MRTTESAIIMLPRKKLRTGGNLSELAAQVPITTLTPEYMSYFNVELAMIVWVLTISLGVEELDHLCCN